MMQQKLEQLAREFTEQSPLNRVRLEKGQQEIRLFETPIFGYASAGDALFDEYRKPEVIGPHFLKPEEWLEGARSVVSFFLPFTEAVRQSNGLNQSMPGEGWLYGRVEGQQFVNALCNLLVRAIREQGGKAESPCVSERFHTVSEPDGSGLSFTSNWSERHVAFACGLGTFGLSKGIITERGMAGRLGSVVTDLDFTPTARDYTQVYERCIHCGQCISRCPGNAISFEHGKDHSRCLEYQKSILHHLLPRFGCGLCQTNVPCESCNPSRKD